MRAALVTIFLLAVLGLAIWFSVSMWMTMPDVQMSRHGYIAMFLGIFVTIAVGIGLMALLFYSSRRGYDEAADRGFRDEHTHDPD